MAKYREGDYHIAEYLFHEGTNYTAYNYFGAHLNGDECTFRVWAPNARDVYVVGSFNEWEKYENKAYRLTSGGIFECVIKGVKEFDSYKYLIITQDSRELYKADPYAFHAETRPETASKVYELGGFNWTDKKWIKKRQVPFSKPVSIYEMHLGSWRKYEDGNTFNYKQIAREIIPYVKEMGFTHIEILPIMEYPYDKSWGYQVTGYFAPTSRYGTPKELMEFINLCHEEDIGVILDWVPAHFPKDAHGLYEFDGGFCYEYEDELKREHPEWGTHIFDFGKKEVNSFLISSACHWIENYHVDGLRVDAVASMLYLDYGRKNGEFRPNKFGGNENIEAKEFLIRLNARVFSKYKGVMMIAEESTAWPKVTYPVTDGGLGFSFKWNMGWMNDSLLYMKQNPFFRKGVHDALTFSFAYAFSEKYILPLSHDEVVHGKASLLSKMPGEYEDKFENLKAYYAYMYAHPGKKLLFMGAEFGQFIEWNEENELDWNLLSYDAHRNLKDFVCKLNHTYKKYAPLYELDASPEGFEYGVFDDDNNNVISFFRKDLKGNMILSVSNFSGLNQENYKIGVPKSGVYREILSTCGETVNKNIRTKKGKLHAREQYVSINIPAYSTLYFYKRAGYKSKNESEEK